MRKNHGGPKSGGRIPVAGWLLLAFCLWTGGAKLNLAAATAPAAPGGAPPAAAGPKFHVRAYDVRGDTLLSARVLSSVLLKYTGTNVGKEEIVKAGSELQMEYRARGYPTVNVTIPPQQITNGIVQIRVFEGRLSGVVVTNNHYFSSNNIIRCLPSLHSNIVINGPILQAELDRANGNQDRQIYPQLEPGPTEGTTLLRLKIKDRLPLHAKTEFNNQATPGTPDSRVNSSAAYNNLWQLDHSLGLQYSFSPDLYKDGKQWNFYDAPMVANYSAFYRMPLGAPQEVAEEIAGNPNSFGYDEATRKFRLPPPTGRPELNLYASRSAIDTGLMDLLSKNYYKTNGDSMDRRDVQQDLTVNQNLGARLTIPSKVTDTFQSAFSFGPDFKTYELTSAKTNIFTITKAELDYSANPASPTTNYYVFVVPSAVPTTHRQLDYLPLSVRYDASWRGPRGVTAVGLGLAVNAWYSGSVGELRDIANSTKASGHWVVLSPSISRDMSLRTNWPLSIRFEGQAASEPLISNEQFGLGGVNNVRGYKEGEVFGDAGWRLGLEQKTPPHLVGAVGNDLLTLRGSLYMDYAEAYLLDAGHKARTELWGAGFGGVMGLGSHWESRLLFSWPLLTTAETPAFQPRFNFSLTAQF